MRGVTSLDDLPGAATEERTKVLWPGQLGPPPGLLAAACVSLASLHSPSGGGGGREPRVHSVLSQMNRPGHILRKAAPSTLMPPLPLCAQQTALIHHQPRQGRAPGGGRPRASPAGTSWEQSLGPKLKGYECKGLNCGCHPQASQGLLVTLSGLPAATGKETARSAGHVTVALLVPLNGLW